MVPAGPSAKKSCLRLEVHAAGDRISVSLVESPPVWITTPTLSLARGQIVCIRGKVRVPSPIRGSVDGLMIVDSLGGEALAERFGQTDGWREFKIYRVASEDDEFNLTFALTGLGEALIDDVSVQLVTSAGDPTSQPSDRGPIVNSASQSTASGAPQAFAPVMQAQRGKQIFSPPLR
jgi:hypothetical protein